GESVSLSRCVGFALMFAAVATPAAAQLSVTPKGQPRTVTQGSGNRMPFIAWSAVNPTSVSLTLSATGEITSCTFHLTHTQTLNRVSLTGAAGLWFATPLLDFTTTSGGSGMLKMKVTTNTTPAVVDSAWYIITVPPVYSTTIVVAPDTVTVTPGQNVTTTFTVKNVGNMLDTLSFFRSCSGLGATSCAGVSPSGATVKPESTATVQVQWIGGAAGTNATIRMSAVDAHSNAMSAIQNVIVPPAVGLDVVDANPGVSFNRANCLTVAVAPHMAFECGDLRITHPLP